MNKVDVFYFEGGIDTVEAGRRGDLNTFEGVACVDWLEDFDQVEVVASSLPSFL